MNETAPNLVTTYSFKGGKEYVLKMRVTTLRGNCQRSLDLSVTDKYTGEDWHSAYDTACELFLVFLIVKKCFCVLTVSLSKLRITEVTFGSPGGQFLYFLIMARIFQKTMLKYV